MVDDLTPQSPMTPSSGAPVGDPGQKPGFFKTTAGKITAIVLAVLAFLVIAGVVTFAVITFVFVDAVQDGFDQAVNQGQGAQGSSAEATVAPIVEPSEVPLSAIFTFRDIFNPLIKPEPEEESTSTVTPGSGTSTPGTPGSTVGEPDTLYLQDIVVENGVSKAVLLLNGATFTLAEGEAISGTPWLVLDISTGAVTMLYGDSQVTLVVGQGVSSK